MLEMKGITKAFGPVNVLRDVDFNVRAGEVHALLGENGAGKSTMMKILCGNLQADKGTTSIDGTQRTFTHYNDAIEAGIGIVFQEFSLIPYLTAVENIFLGRELTNRFHVLNRKAMRDRAKEVLDKLGVDVPLNVAVAKLSVAEQQFVEIAKALALNARILALDEPTATLTPSECKYLFKVINDLKRQGVAIIFISHHLEEIFEICDRITVLRDGEYVGTHDVNSIDTDTLVEMMVGRRIENNFPPKPDSSPHARVVIDAKEIQLRKNGPVSVFQLRQGEILGFSGLVGSGRTETALSIMGAYPAASVNVEINGDPIAPKNPSEALARGIGLLPESRKEQGLITAFSIMQNISINNYGKYRFLGCFLDLASEREHTEKVMRDVQMKAPGPYVACDTLSGGNQQKVVIARWLNHHTPILIFDEPTRGIDVGAKAEIYQLMRQLTEDGYSIIMISSELPEVTGLSDRVCVFRNGGIVATLEGDAINSEQIMKYATTGQLRYVA
ncbi:sugar ABC transporter ATP-binding protein [Roseinatronobacter sp. S2]|uniref:sugar ABC transporter ATP-binding protein n=1 Tax=Roseinatronobacter sp. S2 TaxID=3035471 RepID=UPI00240FF6A3|nr:sugar ABC transporter ATP-binding protein [Roseinatronobacter sp. S2]WFE75850.1 sugar ABC transporter ATP-binding protein [Roseinatronobacter sp. S2]